MADYNYKDLERVQFIIINIKVMSKNLLDGVEMLR